MERDMIKIFTTFTTQLPWLHGKYTSDLFRGGCVSHDLGESRVSGHPVSLWIRIPKVGERIPASVEIARLTQYDETAM